MKILWLLLMLSMSTLAQVEILKSLDNKIYNPRMKGVSDLVVDMEFDKLKDQLNAEKTFGHIKELKFRFSWTAQPERLAVEVIGLPDGFKEIKDSLKQSVTPLFEDIINQTFEKRFSGFELSRKSNLVVLAKDKNSLAQVGSHDLVFEPNGVLKEIKSHRPVGEMVTRFIFDKAAFTEGRMILKSQETSISENNTTVNVKKEVYHQVDSGVGVPKEIVIITKQTVNGVNAEDIQNYKFTEYKINKGEALKYFLSEKKE